jgi:hypothetical protein
VRTYFLGKVTSSEPDKTWYGFDVYAWSIAECNVAIMCACAPSLVSITSRYFHGMSSSPGGNSDGGSGNSDGAARDLKNGRKFQPYDIRNILTLLFQAAILRLNQATAPPQPLHHLTKAMSFTALGTYFVTRLDTPKNFQSAKKPRSIKERWLSSRRPTNMAWIA